MNIPTALIFSFLITAGYSARILVVCPLPGRSHNILSIAAARTLMEAGHDVTIISTYSEKNLPKSNNGSWTEIILSPTDEGRHNVNFFELGDISPLLILASLNSQGVKLVEKTLNDPGVQKLLKSDAKFDLVILEQLIADALNGLAYYYDAPLILLSSVGANSFINPLIGNPGPPSYIPHVLLSYSNHMTFFERVKNTLFTIVNYLNSELLARPQQNLIMKKYFPNVPDLSEINYNISLVLLNSHVSTSQPKPLVPAMVEIGGYHVFPPKKLPTDLQEYLDSATDGAIYFSMGSHVQSTSMPEEQKQAILRALSKLKEKVLWKFEDDNLPGKPENVKISKWLPQQDILAHPNVKLFITHGGMLSTTETIYHGVPVLAIPIFGDQKLNAAQIVLSGFGISVPFKELTEEKITNALNEVLNNPKYRENAQKRKSVYQDQQTSPRETLVYWVEYVLRHKGASHLRVSALDLAWYQYILLDVFVFLIVICVLFIFLTYKSIPFIAKKCRRQNKKLKTN